MSNAKPGGALPVIFSFFLGLIVTAFVGVGVYTFHPSPEADFRQQLEELDRGERDVRDSRPPEQSEDRERIRALDEQRSAHHDAMREARNAWALSTSIVLIVFATLVMAISLVRADRLPVISNGLLLGGIFIMLYGVGWIVATDSSVTRFVVMTVALVITLTLGYQRFARRRRGAPAAATDVPIGAELGDLSERVRSLEQRVDRAATALGSREER
ncbi:MAG: hypothetical protein DHS20C21_20690 [Gemmatimonadota bacterium]|nr:MAG: hypothetical protein DHS20C21_20690 [Gemmatimonadota bacterium]